MRPDLQESTLADFARDLADKRPVPGGGGASAYAGALSASLAAMVGNYTVGKRRYAEHEDEVAALIREMSAASVRLLGFVEDDAEAYASVGAAYALDKADPERPARIEEACRAAALVPYAAMGVMSGVVDALVRLESIGSVMLLSDVGCGAALVAGALDACRMTVFVNTAALEDAGFASEIEAGADAYMEKAAVARECAERVANRLRRRDA